VEAPQRDTPKAVGDDETGGSSLHPLADEFSQIDPSSAGIMIMA
jgi:hypothetical protein